MFIYTNPPHKSKKAKKQVADVVKKKRKKKYKAFSIPTLGGGRLMASNGKTWSSIFSRHLRPRGVAQNVRSSTMAHTRRGSKIGALSMPRRQSSVLDYKGFLKNIVGVTPIIGGVIANGLVTTFLGSKIPYAKQGIGNLVLGVATATGLGALTGTVAKNKDLSKSVMIGGIVGTLGCWFQKALNEGLVASLKPGMGDMASWDGGFNGMGDFSTPMAIESAIQPQSNTSAYSLPMTTAQFVPQAQMALPPTPASAAGAKTMASYEQQAIGEFLGNETNFGM